MRLSVKKESAEKREGMESQLMVCKQKDAIESSMIKRRGKVRKETRRREEKGNRRGTEGKK